MDTGNSFNFLHRQHPTTSQAQWRALARNLVAYIGTPTKRNQQSSQPMRPEPQTFTSPRWTDDRLAPV